jgi:hypothetical protein
MAFCVRLERWEKRAKTGAHWRHVPVAEAGSSAARSLKVTKDETKLY